MTRRVAVAGIAIVWLLAGLISFVPISLGLHRANEPVVHDDVIEVRTIYIYIEKSIRHIFVLPFVHLMYLCKG